MNRLLTTLLAIATLSLFSAPASAVLIQGMNNPIKNTAEFTWEVNDDGNLVVTIENTSHYLAEITGFYFNFGDSNSNIDGLVSSTGINAAEGPRGTWRLSENRRGTTRVRTNQGYVGVGSTGTFTFVGDFSDLSSLNDIAVRFRHVGKDQDRKDRGYQCRVECGPAEVPEPGTMVLFGLGLLGLRMAKKRQLV